MVPGFGASPSAKSQEPVARSRGLVIQPPKLSVGAYFELSSQAVVSLFIFPTGSTALSSKPRGRRYIKNYGTQQELSLFKGHPLSCQYGEAYVQWFLLKSVQDITVCEKIRFAVLSLDGPSHGARVWRLGRVPKHRNQWKKQRACYLAPKTLSWCIF